MSAKRPLWIWMGLTLMVHLAVRLRDGWRTSPIPATTFAVAPVKSQPSDMAPIWREEFIDPQFSQPKAHVSSICELPGGRLAAAWYAGSREGARDVAIYFATSGDDATNGWSRPFALVTRETAARETFRSVKKVGNAVLFSNKNGDVYLLFVSVTAGGWSCSSLNLKHSADGGRTWSPSRRLGLSPFFNISELVKNGPTPLENGGWVVPIYHELFGKFPELLWLTPKGNEMEAIKSRPFGGRAAFQPALTVFDEKRAMLLCRTVGAIAEIQAARTLDGGRHWTAPEPIGLPNPNSGLDALRLADGRLLLAFNDAASGRHNLRLAISEDNAVTWRRIATVEDEAGESFSYPFLLQTSDGLIHLTYSWKTPGIKHVAFNLAWLEMQARKARP